MSLPLPAWPPRAADAHKGNFGRLSIVAGSRGLTGAACLAANAAIRCGAGLVTVIAPESQQVILASKLTCAMTLPAPETRAGTLSVFALDTVLRHPATHLLIGPGLGRHKETATMVRHLYAEPKPLVLDADGLWSIAGHTLPKRSAPTIFTPHAGELARLLGSTAETVQTDREAALQAALERYPGSCIILKGHATLVGLGTHRYTNTSGNPGMASGGTGDVLAGMLVALLAQGFTAFEAACLGVYLHGVAGDLARDELGEVSLCAEDLLLELPQAICDYRGK